MVIVDIDDDAHTGQIVLQPNHSWSWRLNLYFLYTLMGVSLTIGVNFLFMGAWLVLPFSILEMLFLLACMYHCVLQCRRQEVITVTQYEVRIEKGMRHPSECWDYKRLWAKFLVQQPKHPWDPAIVSIRSHGQELELGSFLNRQDKIELIEHLKRVVPA
ncbi:MAG: DUF2244 domain-containing protein [Pseudomonadales bacterium]